MSDVSFITENLDFLSGVIPPTVIEFLVTSVTPDDLFFSILMEIYGAFLSAS